MGYCRFENTLMDLRDCDRHIFDDDLSEDEEKARKSLVELCKQIASNFKDDPDEAEAMFNEHQRMKVAMSYQDVRKHIDYGDI